MTRLTTILLASTLLASWPLAASQAQNAPAPAAAGAAPAAAPAPAAMPAPTAMPAPPLRPAADGSPVAPAASATAAASDKKPEPAEARPAVSDREALFEAHLAALHAGLVLTPEQAGLWPPLNRAIRNFDKVQQDRGEPGSDRHQDARQDEEEDEPVAALKSLADNQLRHATALKALADAIDPLYTALDPDQKRRLPMLMRGLVPARGPLANMVERLDHQTTADRDATVKDSDEHADRNDRPDRDEDAPPPREPRHHDGYWSHGDGDGPRYDQDARRDHEARQYRDDAPMWDGPMHHQGWGWRNRGDEDDGSN